MNQYILVLLALASVAYASSADTETSPSTISSAYAWWTNLAIATLQIGVFVGCATVIAGMLIPTT